MSKSLFRVAVFILLYTNAFAYVGPGMGAGIISVIGGILMSIVLALVGIVWYPLKRIISRIKKK